MTIRRITRLALASALSLGATGALATPIDPSSAQVLCHYKKLGDPTGAATGTVKSGVHLPGRWHHDKVMSWGNLFRTPAPPADVERICAQALKQTPDAHRYIGASGLHGSDAFAASHPLWHEGDLRPGKPVERMVAFGDSLSDTGNMRTASRTILGLVPRTESLPSSSWFDGRFSNGPTWIEYLATRHGLVLSNWAVGGAQTRNSQAGMIHGIDRQIDNFFEHMRFARGYDPSRTLFTFMVAGNDFVNDTKHATDIVVQQRDSLLKLVRHGARKVIVVNLPDVTKAPVFRMGREDAADVLKRVEVYNSALASIASSVTQQAVKEGLVASAGDLQIRVVDARSRFDRVLADPKAYGFSNATESCLKIDEDSALTYMQTHAPRKHCEAGRFVFWDTLHPTTRMHELMAGWAAEGLPVGWGLR
ncbi:SGNH/GDSL hydrolase family protein [Bacillus sp. NP157]|nr:SGNH/GDSL hydrolase family protein [Bacillus sp. NP157]